MYGEKIERYLANEMSTEERQNFEMQLLQDADLRNEFEITRNALEDLRWYERMDLKTRLQNIERSVEPDAPERFKVKFSWIAVGFIVLTLLIWIWFKLNDRSIHSVPFPVKNVNQDTSTQHVPESKPKDSIKVNANKRPTETTPDVKKSKHTPQEIYAMVYEPYTDIELENQIRGGDEKNDYEAFCNLYYNERYDKALSVYETLNTDLKTNERVLLIKANAHLALNQVLPAVSILERLHRDTSSIHKKEISWYLGLCYLRLNRIDDAYNLFSDTALRSDPRAKKILREL